MPSIVEFFEKPGCQTNLKQKSLLRQAGHTVIEVNLLKHLWDAASLMSFFKDQPVREWFNPNAPQVKSGAIDPTQLNPGQAMTLLIKDPILIRRPLLRVGESTLLGFDSVIVDNWIGLPVESENRISESCSNQSTLTAYQMTEVC